MTWVFGKKGPAAASYIGKNSQVYKLYFPPVELDQKNLERVHEVQVRVGCGHIGAFEAVPAGWDMKIVNPTPTMQVFQTSAGQGDMAARLRMYSG